MRMCVCFTIFHITVDKKAPRIHTHMHTHIYTILTHTHTHTHTQLHKYPPPTQVEVPGPERIVEVRRRALNSQYRSAGTLKGTPGL